TFDGPARGPEVFRFESEAAGSHVIEIKPFEEEEGRYALQLDRVEPVKTVPAERVDQLLALYDSNDSPGAVVGVVSDGELTFAKGYGRAHLSYDLPFTTETVTNIGSTSKQFTAFSIALLAERGHLSLDDDVRDYIPELPDFGSVVTLRHMMTHTTGYREFLNLIAMTGRQLGKGEFIDRDELIEVVQRQPELQNEPGAEWNYNNTAFGLLTIVVERVTGEEFQDWMKENVFEPLDMHHTMFRKTQDTIVPNSSMGYINGEGGGYVEASDLGGAMGAGGLYTTVGDLAKWMANYHNAVVGNAETMKAMTTRYVLTDGDTTEYGLGLFIDEQSGLKRIQHGGADIAHRSMFMYFPEINSGVVALSNYGSFLNPAGEIAELFFADRMMQDEPVVMTQNEESVAAFNPDDYEPEAFDEFAGRYELEVAPGFILTFRRDGENLYTQATGQEELEISPTSDSTFKLKAVEASLTFHREVDGSVKSLTLHQNGHHIANRLADEPWKPSEADLASYSGRYFSEELETFYDVMVEDSALVITQRRLDNINLTPTKEDLFRGSYPIVEVTFTRDDAGSVDGLLVSNVRSRGIRFDKNAE
ncbi:MAG: serine hydrolase, partial [Rhodothermaceae bacterium]|nr:serine hydrolase [Rhodothermaceae bacterium]